MSLRHYLNVHRMLWNWNHRRVKVGNYPLITSIELTNRCNLACGFCAREEVYRHRGLGDMAYSDYLSILERYPQCVRDLQLFHHGEPTLYPRLADAIQDAKKHGAVGVGFTTNGNFETCKLDEYYEAGLTDICYSFEGTSREVYEKLRVGGDYDLVTENIKRSHELREKYPVVTVISIIESDYTRKGLNEFVEAWRPLVDRVQVSPIHDWAGSAKLDSEYGYCKSNRPVSCNSPWFQAVVHYDGNVVPCCTWLYEPMGNIFGEDLFDIWNNEKWQGLRRELSHRRESHPKCASCYATTSRGQFFEDTCQNGLYPFDAKFLDWMLRPIVKRLRRL